jgi:hypothetical protein
MAKAGRDGRDLGRAPDRCERLGRLRPTELGALVPASSRGHGPQGPIGSSDD